MATLPWAPGPTQNPIEFLMAAAQQQEAKKKAAAEMLLKQQEMSINQQRAATDTFRAQAENQRAVEQGRRADVAEKREQRMATLEEQKHRAAGLQALQPYIDPSSPQFNPQQGQAIAQSMGIPYQVMPNGPEPQAPGPLQAPTEGPIPSLHDSMRGALMGTRTDNPNHEGQVFVDQTENGSAALSPPQAGGTFNFPASKLGGPAQEGSWIPDPRRGRVFVDQVENGSAHLSPPGGGQAFNSPDQGFKEGDWVRDPRGPADPTSIQSKAAQEAMQMEMERQQYQQQLLEAPQRQEKYNRDIQSYQERQKYPQVQVGLGDNGAPVTFDTREMYRQAAGYRASRAAEIAQVYAGDPEAQKIATQMATLGRPDAEIQKAIESFRGHALTQSGEDKRAAQYQTTAAQKMQIARMNAAAKEADRAYAPGGKPYIEEEKELEGEAKDFEQRHQIVGKGGLTEAQKELSSALSEGGIDPETGKPNGKYPNGITQLRIMDKMIRSATGLGVRNQTLKTYFDHLGGLAAKGEGVLQQWVDGRAGRQQWQNVLNSLGSQYGEAEAQGAEMNREWHQAIDNSPAAQRHPDLIKRREGQMFGGLHGFGQPAQKSNPLTDAVKLNKWNAAVQKLSPADKEAVDWANKNPGDPRAARILQLHGLQP